jgi:hypothetical protein
MEAAHIHTTFTAEEISSLNAPNENWSYPAQKDGWYENCLQLQAPMRLV